MAKEVNRTEIGSIGEFGLIDRITNGFENKRPSTYKGIGDDAAVIKPNQDYQVVSTDILVENIHFSLVYCPLKHIGYKAVVVNLSDIYAMNAEPTQILVSIALSSRFSVEAVEEIFSGVKKACEFYNVDLIGGDTTASNKGLIINVVAIGKTKDSSKLSYRDGAKEGDYLCVSGDLGAAYMGLQLLEREKKIFIENPDVKADLENQKYLVERQLKPEARKDIWQFLQAQNIVPTSMIDVSDGLSSELLHICQQSNVGCELEESKIPIAQETYDMALNFNVPPTTCALSGGEDYELLFTVNPKDIDKISLNDDIKIIGEILPAEMGVKLKTKSGNLHDVISLGWNSLKEE